MAWLTMNQQEQLERDERIKKDRLTQRIEGDKDVQRVRNAGQMDVAKFKEKGIDRRFDKDIDFRTGIADRKFEFDTADADRTFNLREGDANRTFAERTRHNTVMEGQDKQKVGIQKSTLDLRRDELTAKNRQFDLERFDKRMNSALERVDKQFENILGGEGGARPGEADIVGRLKRIDELQGMSADEVAQRTFDMALQQNMSILETLDPSERQAYVDRLPRTMREHLTKFGFNTGEPSFRMDRNRPEDEGNRLFQ